jgi:hypothetical protein
MMRRSVTAISVIQRLNQACTKATTARTPKAMAANRITMPKPVAELHVAHTIVRTANRIACQ